MLTGTNAEYVKGYNRRIVLEAIRRLGPVSRADIARSSSLTSQTVSNIVAQLTEEGLVVMGARRSGGKGQPPVEIRLDPSGAYAVGLALDRDHLTGVLIDLVGDVRQRVHYELDQPSPDQALRLMQEATERLIDNEELPTGKIRGIGVALPGQIQASAASITIPTNFPGWEGIPLESRLAAATNLPVYVENDSVAAAIGESWNGVGRSLDNFLYLYFGLGLGGGFILGGQPYRGHGLNAAKIGHISVEPNGYRCSCGNIGCLELYASLGALAEEIRGDGNLLHPDDIEKLYRSGDARISSWLKLASRYLLQALITLENLFDPQAIVLGGRLPGPMTEELLERLRKQLPERRMRGKPLQPQLLSSQLKADAAPVGAATLPLYETLAPNQGLLLKGSGDDPTKGVTMF